MTGHEKAAWKGEPTPDIPDKHIYIMMRELYRLNKAGELPQETAKQFKNILLDLDNQPRGEQRAMLAYCIANLYHRMGGDKALQADAWTLIEYAMARWTDG